MSQFINVIILGKLPLASSYESVSVFRVAIMMDPKTSHKKKALDLYVKCRNIASVDLGQKSNKDIAAEFRIPKSTLSTTLKQRETIYL